MPLYLTVSPDQLRSAEPYGLHMAHMAYRIGSGPHLLRANIPVTLRGGFMILSDHQFDNRGESNAFCQEVLRECLARGFTGVICDFEEKVSTLLGKIISILGDLLGKRDMTLYVTEAYASSSSHSRVLISSAISGGSLRQRFQDALSQYGEGRVAMTIERVAEDFFLPAPSGSGMPLTQEELKKRIDRRGAAIYYSSELCAHYFTYMNRDSGAHFVLFDDASSIRKKIQVAHQLGISDIFIVFTEVDDILKDIVG